MRATLGAWRAARSVRSLLGTGSAGLTTFAGGALTGVTGGSLSVFVLAAALVGAVARRTDGIAAVGAAMAAGSLLVLALGSAWLAQVNGLSAEQALAAGLTPFLAGDLLKAAAALGAWRLGRPAWRHLLNTLASHV